jgi:hypothetical protein
LAVPKENYRQGIHQTVIHWQYPRKTIDRAYTRQLYTVYSFPWVLPMYNCLVYGLSIVFLGYCQCITVCKENYRQAIHQTVIHWQYSRKTIDRPYTRQLYIGSTQGKL